MIERRKRILRLVADRGVTCMKEVVEATGLPNSVVWDHLNGLANDGFLVRTTTPRWGRSMVSYALSEDGSKALSNTKPKRRKEIPWGKVNSIFSLSKVLT